MRALLVYFLCAVAFGNLQSFIHVLSPTDHDDWLIAADRILFFGHDPIKLLEPLVTPRGVNFFLQVYISMMIMPFVAMIVYLHLGKMRAFRDTIVSLLALLWIGYPGYLIIPAIGPQYTLRHTYTRPVFDVERMLAVGFDRLDRATFPSMHTGISLTVLFVVLQHSTNRLYRVAFTIWAWSIVFSTVYLRWHYVADVIAGAAIALLAAYLGPRINDWYEGKPPVERRGVVTGAYSIQQEQP